MYRIEYDIETGLVHNLAIIEDENYPETLIDGVAYYEGDIPEDVEGYETVLYYKLVNTQENPEGISTFAVWEGNLYAEYKPIEGWMELADAKDVADLFIQSQKPKGLRFKVKDNSVFAKSATTLNLGESDFTLSVIATGVGGAGISYPFFGNGIAAYQESGLRISKVNETNNNLNWVTVQGTIADPSGTGNGINIEKIDSTNNIHHIVIIRSGVSFKVIVNGRLIKSTTHDRVLNFSNFIYDVLNTQYFYGGSVYNYAMTEAEALALWNGGRYDEFTLTSELRSKCLLEYKPENIRVDRMINTGTAGSAYDLIYSLTTKPTIIYEAPYKDKIVLEDKTTPDFHPIAVGQRCYTSDGKILEAKLPAKGSEWQVSDWKLQ